MYALLKANDICTEIHLSLVFFLLPLFFKLTHILIVVIIFFFIDHLHSPLGHPLTKNLLLTCAHLLKKSIPNPVLFRPPVMCDNAWLLFDIFSPAHQKNHSFSSEPWYRGVNQKHWIGLHTHKLKEQIELCYRRKVRPEFSFPMCSPKNGSWQWHARVVN